MARVVLENLTKTFDGGVTAVEHMSLDIADQEFMVIVGPSGCGKTTTLRMISGLEKPTSGNITIADSVVNDIPPKDRDIAMVFQNYALYPHMTTFQNMAFALKLRKYPKAAIKKRVTEAAMLLGIEDLLSRKPNVLSGGQRQRVAVGRAIVCNPKVFLFDEPLSNLDLELRIRTRAELKALHQKLETTMIYVTHDQSEAMTLGDRICIMRNGVVQQVGSPLEVYQRPKNRFVAGFLGTPLMNFIEGIIQCEGDNPYFTAGPNRILLSARTKSAVVAYDGKQAILGIRPQHISLQPIAGQGQNTIACSVMVVEPLGDRMDAYLQSNSNDQLIATVDPHTKIHAGQTITMYIDVEKAHIFKPGDTGENITQSTIDLVAETENVHKSPLSHKQ